jgi:sRNA-binding regulator protein Hfq
MMKYAVFLLGIFSFFILAAISQADTIHLKNGFSIEGTIKYQDEEKIILATKDGEVEFYFSEIKSIESKKKTFPFLKKRVVTLYLKNGAVLSGSLVKEDDNEVLIWWHGGEVSFLQSEIERLEYGKRIKKEKEFLFPVVKEEKWPYKNDVAVQLTNLEILDFPISEVYKDKVIFKEELEGGGFIEQEIARSKIEQLYFKPVENERSQKIEDNLRKLFPHMKFYQEGQFTIVTDSHPVWVREYKKAIRQHMSEFYLTFFDLLKDHRPKIQNFIVIFDEWEDFVEFAIANGVPGWQVAGYFSPRSEVLYMFNVLGEKFSQKLFTALIEEPGAIINRQKEELKRKWGEYAITIEGLADKVKFKYERYYKIVYGYYKTETLTTLRHELTHELFYNFGLQNVVVSKVKKQKKAQPKKEHLKGEDLTKRQDLLKRLFTLRRYGAISLEAANSWLIEGIATYCETYPLGGQNKRWLFLFQEAERKKRILPLEQLTVYKMGSFPGVAPEAMLYAYAQSWAFIYFLMNNYPSEFLQYQEKISTESPEKMEDIEWLLASLNKDLREIEREFLEYMKQLPLLEDPEVNWVLLKHEIFGR